MCASAPSEQQDGPCKALFLALVTLELHEEKNQLRRFKFTVEKFNIITASNLQICA